MLAASWSFYFFIPFFTFSLFIIPPYLPPDSFLPSFLLCVRDQTQSLTHARQAVHGVVQRKEYKEDENVGVVLFVCFIMSYLHFPVPNYIFLQGPGDTIFTKKLENVFMRGESVFFITLWEYDNGSWSPLRFGDDNEVSVADSKWQLLIIRGEVSTCTEQMVHDL
jgi:hypothetical protein